MKTGWVQLMAVDRVYVEAKKLWYMMLANFRIRFLFSFGIILQVVNITMGAASYYFLTQVIRTGTSPVASYGTDLVSYIIVGMALNPMLSLSMLGLYYALISSYYGRDLERIMMTPTSVYTLFASNVVAGYIGTIISSVIYLVVGVFVFGIRLGGHNVGLALIVFLLGVVATWGLGMLFTAVFFYTDSGKSGSTPYTAFFSSFAYTFSGATFPIEVVPAGLRLVALFLPQTHALRSVRLHLGGLPQPGSWQVVIGDVAYLVVFCCVTMPLGVLLVRRGLRKIMKEGYVPRTGGISIFMW